MDDDDSNNDEVRRVLEQGCADARKRVGRVFDASAALTAAVLIATAIHVCGKYLNSYSAQAMRLCQGAVCMPGGKIERLSLVSIVMKAGIAILILQCLLFGVAASVLPAWCAVDEGEDGEPWNNLVVQHPIRPWSVPSTATGQRQSSGTDTKTYTVRAGSVVLVCNPECRAAQTVET